ncbi:MAG: 1-deoxy-D-xylulose-5-phosphate reductoisomerase [Chloroflexi bacterium]|nr:1-deoxy-D-xylulose-5-phosphate reductoisomerase [Chloroflexota bacterium]
MKRLAILGSTGSIGRQTLDVVRACPGHFSVVALAGGLNFDLLERQVREFRPRLAFTAAGGDPPGAGARARLATAGARFAPMEEIAADGDVDLVVVATSGKAGLSPCFAALRAGKTVALANKEMLVMAGEMATAEAAKNSARILPIDSEHSALWQCLRGEQAGVSRLILTASGGPFWEWSPSDLSRATAREALRHPTWSMGPKVTVDSATLMNKGLEVIEARWLFQVPYDNIEVVVHPESIVHSMVEFVDGSVKAQMSYPDMRLPIQYALSYPERLPARFVPGIDLAKTARLTFAAPDASRFPCLPLAVEAGKMGGTYPAALCGADEVAVDLFIAGQIGFKDIPCILEGALARHENCASPSLAEIIAADARAREIARDIAAGAKSR